MFKNIKKEIEWGGSLLTIETGKVARQADGAVIASLGGTVVLATAVAQKKPKEGIDFFPLTVHYREMAFAAGKIPGGFFKREGRPSEKEVLASRLIDRPLRPLFADNFYNETQVICTLLSHDMQNDPEVLALVAASAALAISGIPFNGPVGAARVGYRNGEYILNPNVGEDLKDSDLDLLMAGTKTSVLMVESEAKELSEEIMLGAVEFGHKSFQPIIALIEELAHQAGKERWVVEEKDYTAIAKAVKKFAEKDVIAAYNEVDKQARTKLLDEVRSATIAKLTVESEMEENAIKSQLKKLEKDVVRNSIIIDTKKRIDGRGFADIRRIETEISVLPRTHGSALFTRGETQSLSVVTLGTGDDMQIIDALEGESRQHFMLHYNFPPYSVGEATQLKPPGRREIGHGKLAWRALNTVLPAKEDFPYAIRVVSEITESNGSSSMATVCASSLAMMDAGVPLRAPVAGIAMGLILEDKTHVVLSDIMGDEDHLGDMDFKVAGTRQGITALQMDIKINGITTKIMEEALDQAKVGRMHILDKMSETIEDSKAAISQHAPTITTIKINQDKIREVIGSGGKVIRAICEESGAKIEIEDDGTIKIAAVNEESSSKALKLIQDIVCEPEINKIYEGRVVKILDFGAFVNFMGSRDGLVHISEISLEPVDNVDDVLKESEMVKVKVLDVDNKGKVRLSMKCVDQQTGEDISGQIPESHAPSSRPPSGPRQTRRGDDRGGNRDGGDRNRNRDRGDRSRGPDRGPRPDRERAPDNRERSERPAENRERSERQPESRERGEREYSNERAPSGNRDRGERGGSDGNRRPAPSKDGNSERRKYFS